MEAKVELEKGSLGDKLYAVLTFLGVSGAGWPFVKLRMTASAYNSVCRQGCGESGPHQALEFLAEVAETFNASLQYLTERNDLRKALEAEQAKTKAMWDAYQTFYFHGSVTDEESVDTFYAKIEEAYRGKPRS